MEKEGKAQKVSTEPDFLLQWGNRKKMRCMKVKEPKSSTNKSDCLGKKKITSGVDGCIVPVTDKDSSSSQPPTLNKNMSSLPLSNRKLSVTMPEKEDRYYTTRGSLGLDEKLLLDHHGGVDDRGGFVWPKLFISLSSKEKEEDFMAMKGCKLPQRPKKRAKLLQRSLLLVMPGTWLSDLCQERYEVREKKASKKRPRGLKAMGSLDSDSD